MLQPMLTTPQHALLNKCLCLKTPNITCPHPPCPCNQQDVGVDPEAQNPNTRIYMTRAAQPWHVDSCDVVALLCLAEAQVGFGWEGGRRVGAEAKVGFGWGLGEG